MGLGARLGVGRRETGRVSQRPRSTSRREICFWPLAGSPLRGVGMTTADRKRSRLVALDAEPRKPRQEAPSARPALVPASAPDTRAAPARRSALYERFEAVLAGSGIGLDGANPWDLRVRDERFFGKVLRQGTLGLGE